MTTDQTKKLIEFFSQYKELHYKKGELILHAGQEPSGVCLVIQGYARQYAISSDGQELNLIFFPPKDFFPVIWAINQVSYDYYLEAMTPLSLYCAPREAFLNFLLQHPEAFLDLTQKVLTRMNGFMFRMEHLAFGTAYNKVAAIISLAAERFGESKKDTIVIPFPFPHKQIASCIGLTRETVSIEIKKLEKLGLVGYQKRLLVVHNLPELKKQSSPHLSG
jgi:CRP-like cAMP-binding protein